MKKLLALLLALTLVLSLAACGKDEPVKDDGDSKETTGQTDTTAPEETEPEKTEPEETEPEETEPEETEPSADTGLRSDVFVIPDTAEECDDIIEMTSRNCNRMAMNFVEAIAKNCYSSAVQAFDVGDSPFISSEDIAYAALRSKYRSIADRAGKEVYLFVDESQTISYSDSSTVKVQLRSTEDAVLETFSVLLMPNGDGGWTVSDGSFYQKNCYLAVSGGATLYIDGVEVSKDLIEGKTGYSSLKDLYRIPVIGTGTKTLKLSCNAFEAEKEIEPLSNNDDEPINFTCVLADQELNEALNATETLWEALYQDYINGVPTEEWAKYFASTAPASYAEEVKTSLDMLTKDNSGHKITIMQNREGKECFYITDQVIVMNIQYQIDSVWDAAGWTQYGRCYSHILLTIENGEYKIYQVSDMLLFSNGDGNAW